MPNSSAPDDRPVPGVRGLGRLARGRVPEGDALAPPVRRAREPELADDERFAELAARDRTATFCSRCSRRRSSGDPSPTGSSSSERAASPRPGQRRRRRARRSPGDAREAVVAYDHPTLGHVRDRREPASASPGEPPLARAPFFGEHSAELVRELCGYTEDRIDGARRRRASSGRRRRGVEHERGVARPLLRGLRVGRRLPELARPHRHGGRQRLVHEPDDEHEPDALQPRWAARTEFGRPLVVSTLTLALVLGLSVADTSENAAANLGWSDISFRSPSSSATRSGRRARSSRRASPRAGPRAGSSGSGRAESTSGARS